MIVVSELILEEALAVLASARPVHYDPDLHRSPEELAALLGSAEALVVRNQTLVTASLLAGAPALKVVGRLGSGLDNIDTRALAARGVALCLAEGANALAVAEWVLGYLFLVTKPIVAADRHVRGGGWDRRAFGGEELAGKVLGLIGFGAVGRRLALRARALGLQVLAYDPYVPRHDPLAADLGIRLVPLDECLARADFVSIHVPLTEETRNLLGEEALARMQPHAHLVNTARGGVVDEAALYRALADGRLGGALLDVQSVEPPDPDHPLYRLPNCLFTPHVAGLSREARRRVDLMVAEAVVAALGA